MPTFTFMTDGIVYEIDPGLGFLFEVYNDKREALYEIASSPCGEYWMLEPLDEGEPFHVHKGASPLIDVCRAAIASMIC